MYREGVRCSDCHNPHSLEPYEEGNDVCTRCHQTGPPEQFTGLKKKDYDTPRAPLPRTGFDWSAQCINCHAPSKELHGRRPAPGPQLPNSATRPDREDRHAKRLQRLPRAPGRDPRVGGGGGRKVVGRGTAAALRGDTGRRGGRGDAEARADLVDLSRDDEQAGIVRASAPGTAARLRHQRYDGNDAGHSGPGPARPPNRRRRAGPSFRRRRASTR